jgi:TnpA family transposase
VLRYLAVQLDVAEPACIELYRTSDKRWDHAIEIRRRFGYREFGEGPVRFRLTRWLYATCWTGTDRPSVLFDRATAWLVDQKVLLPGVSVLERLVARLRRRVQERIWGALVKGLSQEILARLETLLTVPSGGRTSLLDRLRNGPTLQSVPELVRAIQRLDEVRALGINIPTPRKVPPGRVLELARFASTAKATAIERLPPERRAATLVAFVHTLEASAQDDVLDLLDILLTGIFSEAVNEGKKARIRTIKDLDTAALQLCEVVLVMLDDDLPNSKVRPTAFAIISREDLKAAFEKVVGLIRPPQDPYYKELQTHYRRVRRFLPALLRSIQFEATPAGRPVWEALQALKPIEDGRTSERLPDLPLTVVNNAWRPHVVGADEQVDVKAYTFCVLDRFRTALRRRDLFVAPSTRYADPRIGLLDQKAWESVKPNICRTLGHSPSAQEELTNLRQQLDQTYHAVAARLAENPAVRIETVNGQEDLILSPLDKLDEPASLVALRAAVEARMPRIELPDLLLEVAARTGFPSEFTHISERDSRAEDLATSICAVLVAEACNTGMEPLIRNDIPALRRARLSWVSQNYFRNETLTDANARLVAAQNQIPLVQSWGGGEVASADGLRFVVPVRTIHAGPNPKYFGVERGVTYYNLVSNQFTGLNAITVPGTLRDSLVLLGVVLEQQTELNPIEIMTDTGAYSDVIFGLFWLLGYRFSPRIADIGDARFWRIDPTADYGALNGIARHKINMDRIIEPWDDVLRLAGSLKLGHVQAGGIMRMLQVADRPTKWAQAVAELGRIDKTLHMLTFIDDETKRRRVLTQLNRGEARHSLARIVFHGKRGELRQRYREGQEDQLGALGLVVNVIVLWNTIYMDAVLEQLRKEGYPINPEDVARLSPLMSDHINVLGRYAFAMPESVARGELRPLRNPTTEEE